MTRRELEDALADLKDRVDTGDVDRPDPLTSEEKQALDDVFDVDPWARGPSDAQQALGRIQDAAGGD